MKVTVTIELEHALLPKLAELLDEKPVAAKKTSSKKKDEEPIAIKDPMPAVEDTEPVAIPEITDSEVRTEAAKLLRAGKQPELKALLDKYGVPRATALSQEQRIVFLKDLEALNE